MAELRVVDVPERNRYEAFLGDEPAGIAEYQRRGQVVVLTHTVVEPAAEGKGVGSALARTALDTVRAEGVQVVPECTFMAGWLDRHPEYVDLVAESPRA